MVFRHSTFPVWRKQQFHAIQATLQTLQQRNDGLCQTTGNSAGATYCHRFLLPLSETPVGMKFSM